jgi:indole-3-glycerol phosphate synthase/phosphoribosylanthranilate isomerase
MVDGVLGEIIARKRSDVAARLSGASFDPEPTRRSLKAALSKHGARFIMEVKKASPSGHRSSVAVPDAVSAYAPVADAISVLTDAPYFNGSLEDLRTVRSLFDGPILAKDFVVDPRQVTEARAHGADAVLAIVAALTDEEIVAIRAEAQRLGMDVLVEVHDEPELERALGLGADIVGINNRDLKTLKTDLSVTERLAVLVPEDRVLVSESGVRERADVERLGPKADAFLVGSSLMASENVGEAARALVFGRVKVCGVARPEDSALAADAGATHIGMIFAEKSPRRVGKEAAEIADVARSKGIKAVGVFQDQEPEFVAATAAEFGLDAVQLHGKEDLSRFAGAAGEIWAACAIGDEAEVEREGADRIVYDTRANGRSGGTGKAFDWSRIALRPHLATGLLAGGIGPQNARDAQRVGSYGIDVSSGVEAAPGVKDPEKVKALFDSLRIADRRAQ